MTKRQFPNLFIIGAMKAGTSSLHEYLHQHPQIFMARLKEPQYFAPHRTRLGQAWGQGNPFPEPGIEWYLRLFENAGNVAYAGESSASYTARPWVVGCERRMYQHNPEARIIYIMRDPVERAISHYWHFVKDGREDRDMLTALRRNPMYVNRSNYAMQLQPYFDFFSRDQIFTLTLENLAANSAELLRSLFNWLGVDTDVSIDISDRFNVSDQEFKKTRRHCVFLDTMMKHWRWKQYEPWMPGFVPRLLRQLTYQSVVKSEFDESPAIAYLRPILQQHTQELKKLLGREFPEWTSLYPSNFTMKTASLNRATA